MHHSKIHFVFGRVIPLRLAHAASLLLLMLSGCAINSNNSLLALNEPPTQTALGASAIDLHGGFGQVFKCSPDKILITGTGYPNVDSKDFWPESILGAFRPSGYKYFLLRKPLKIADTGFDIVFFNDDGEGVFMNIPMDVISYSTFDAVEFSYEFSGGGEAGSVKGATKFDILGNNASNGAFVLSALIKSNSVFSTLGVERKREQWHAEITFNVADSSVAIRSKAMSINVNIKDIVAKRLGR